MNMVSRRKRIGWKTIACMIICVMVFQLSPNIVVAVSDAIQQKEVVLRSSNQEENEQNILGESVEKRRLNEKHFRLEDGSMIAAIYPENVHYEKNGKLEEIDNTLKEENEQYKNTANSFEVSFEKIAKKEKLGNMKKDGTEIQWSLKEVQKERGKQEKENTENTELSSSVLEKQKEKGNKEKQKLEKEAIKETKEIRKVEAKIEKAEEKGKEITIEKKEKEEKLTKTKTNSQIAYLDILEKIDLRYNVISNGVKESIVIKEKEAIPNSFVFVLETGNLIAEISSTKEIQIYETDKNNSVYTIEAPYMFDSNLIYSDNIEVTLKETTKTEETTNTNTNNRTYEMTITPNKEWLEANERKYPVTIDPTIETSQMRSKIKDTYIYEGDSNNALRGKAHILRIGNSKFLGNGNPARGLIKFDLPELTAGDQVIWAGLNIWNYPKTEEWTPPIRELQINVHKMTANWEEDTAHWNILSNQYNTRAEDYVLYRYNSNTPNTCNAQFVNITNIAKEWYTTGNNYGLMLKENAEIKGYTAQSDMYFISSDTSSAYESGRPVVTIVYRNQTGLENYLSYHKQEIGRAGTVYTNDYNGNVVWTHQDASTPGNRLPVSINHVYNTNDKEKQIGYGYGMRLNISQTIELVAINTNEGAKEYAKYTDEDGTIHYFEKQGNTNIYKDEDGLGLELTLETNWIFTMKDKKGNLSRFEGWNIDNKPLWHLKEIEDTEGNKITINFYLGNQKHFVVTSVTDGAGKSITFTYDTNEILKEIIDPAGRKTQYHYHGDGSFNKITYNDGLTSFYDFSFNKLYGLSNVDGTTVRYEYYPEKTSRVASIREIRNPKHHRKENRNRIWKQCHHLYR